MLERGLLVEGSLSLVPLAFQGLLLIEIDFLLPCSLSLSLFVEVFLVNYKIVVLRRIVSQAIVLSEES